MFEGLLVHPKTADSIELFLKAPSHALLISGPQGAGKLTLAKAIAAALLEIAPDKLGSYPHFTHIAREESKQDISIDAIRQANKSLRLQIPGKARIRRIVLVEDADLMNQEAQNAFLKSLEEPNDDAAIILTSSTKTGLLPTVISRAFTIEARPVSLAQAKQFFKDASDKDLAAAWNLSQGAPGLLAALISGDDNELKQAVDQAKTWLSKTRYNRLLEVDTLSRNKTELAALLDGLARVIKALYRNSASKNLDAQTTKLLAAMQIVISSRKALDTNVLPRLVALRLTLSLPI